MTAIPLSRHVDPPVGGGVGAPPFLSQICPAIEVHGAVNHFPSKAALPTTQSLVASVSGWPAAQHPRIYNKFSNNSYGFKLLF